jgi:hypothetical protein
MAVANWVTEDMLDAIRQVESGGNNNAVSPAGAVGQYQFLPENVHDMGYGVKKGFDPMNPVEARAAAKAYLTGMKEYHGFTNDQTLQAYNYGPTRMEKYLKKGGRASASEIDNNLPTETIEYLDKVGAEMKIAEKKRLIEEYGKQGNAQYPQGMRPVTAPANPLVSNNAVLSGYNKPNNRGFIGEFVEESIVPAIKDLYGNITGKSQVPVDPRGNKLLGEMGIVPEIPGNQTDSVSLSDADKRQLQYTTQQSELKAKRASDLAQDKAEYEAYANDLKAKGAAPKSFDRWKTEKTWAANNAQIAYDKSKKLADKMTSAQSSYDIFISNGGNSDDITLEDWSKYDTKRRIMEMRKVDDAAAKAAGGSSSLKDASRVNANVVPAITSTGDQHLRSQVDLSTVEKLEQDKKLKELGEEYNKQGNSQYPEGMRPIADAPVPPIPETIEEYMLRVSKEYDDSLTGTPDNSSVDTDSGIVKDGNGKIVNIPPDQVKGIFGKASELFGDIFTSADLKRMVLYTVGGMITGGSMEGSFKWAGMQVMKENGINEQNQATKDAAALLAKERKEATQLATATRAKETYMASKVADFKLLKKQEYDMEVAKRLADYNLGLKRITENAKAPDGLKVNGVNYEVQGRWSGDAWINTSTKTIAGVKPGQKFPPKTKKWNGSLHDPSSSGMRDRFVKIAEDLQDGTEDADGKPNTLGDSAVNSYSKFRAWVDEKAKDQGYYLDLNDPLAEQVYRISVKQAIDANAGKKSGKAGGMVTPESFFDGSLIRGYLGGQGADVNSLFTDGNGKPINVKTNDRLIGDIELHRKRMQKRFGGNYTTAQATHNFWTAWNNTDGKGISDDQRDDYNNGAGSNVSGFSKFVREYTLKDAAKQ